MGRNVKTLILAFFYSLLKTIICFSQYFCTWRVIFSTEIDKKKVSEANNLLVILGLGQNGNMTKFKKINFLPISQHEEK